MCKVLKVSRSGYYAWKKRSLSQLEMANALLAEQIRAIFTDSRKTYGAPRIHAVLERQGIKCGHNRVARLMRLHGIVARPKKKYRPVTTQRKEGAMPAPNLLDQNFTAEKPNQKWVGDITYIDTTEGWLYLAAVLDLFSRKVVGWSMGVHIDTDLALSALQMAWKTRRPLAGLLHHSDQGSQYTSSEYQQVLTRIQALPSMNHLGTYYDNAVMESFFSTLKTECVTYQFATREEARHTIFEYIEGWYNRLRIHSTLNYLSPMEYEALHGN
jgi:transposase InsO family protein